MTQKVLIAHQSTIPHYRVSFYNSLEQLRPAQRWEFDVAFDTTELNAPKVFAEPLQKEDLQFSVLDSPLISTKFRGRRISYQRFWRHASSYNLIIVENAVNNLAYPLSQLHQLHGVKFAYWGHGRDHDVVSQSGYKRITETMKLWLSKRADGFFAYTERVKAYLVANGMPPDKIFVLNNTIDILLQRREYEHLLPEKALHRCNIGVTDRQHVLLFVGRFTPNKRLDFLIEAFTILSTQHNNYSLLLVGSGPAIPDGIDRNPNIRVLGPQIELHHLAPIYTASDLFVFPGSVGLGPVQALCYDLPVLTIDSPTHNPEIEYLSPQNAIVLPSTTTPAEYARCIVELFEHPTRLHALRSGVWDSISHLTVEQMARNFIDGVNRILA